MNLKSEFLLAVRSRSFVVVKVEFGVDMSVVVWRAAIAYAHSSHTVITVTAPTVRKTAKARRFGPVRLCLQPGGRFAQFTLEFGRRPVVEQLLGAEWLGHLRRFDLFLRLELWSKEGWADWRHSLQQLEM